MASTLKTDEQISAFIEKLHDEVVGRHKKEKAQALREALNESRNAVIQLAVPETPRHFSRPLPYSSETVTTVSSVLLCQPCKEQTSSNASDSKASSPEGESEQQAGEPMMDTLLPDAPKKPRKLSVTVTFQKPRGRRWGTTIPAILLEGAHEPRPTGTTAVFLKSRFAIDDQKELSYVPYFGDNDRDDVVNLYSTKGRERMMEFGPEYQERETRRVIQETLELADEKLGGTRDATLQKRLEDALSTLLEVDLDRIRSFDDEATITSPKKSNSDLDYLGAVDSYRQCFCRRCFTYDCNIHGILSKPDLDIQAELGIEKERSDLWKEDDAAEQDAIALSNTRPLKDALADLDEEHRGMTELTSLQKAMCERSYVIHQGDFDKIAITLGVPRRLVIDYATSKGMNLYAFEHILPETQGEAKKRKTDKSMKRYNPSYLQNIEKAEIHPFFVPCNHTGPCTKENCSCVQQAFFCTKHCVWGEKGENFFRGCSCKGNRCRTKACPCFASRRECDPDLCVNCRTCTDPPGKPATSQMCRNDNVSMRRNRQLLVAKSEAAGWGVYTKHALKRGDYIHEYLGELISQEEAERRGVIYDKMNMSYLFNLSSDLCVDASRKGNKTRFMNHSSKPNVEVKMIWVNGDIRIAFFAGCDIDAQTELFFDYRYTDSMDNDLIVKAGIVTEWMEDPTMASKVSMKSVAKKRG